MKKIRLKQAETSVASSQPPEVSPEADKQNREIAVNLLASVVEKIQKLPPVPVKESWSDLIDQFRHGVKRQPVIIDRYDGRKIMITESGGTIDVTDELTAESTLLNVSDEKFTDLELAALEKYNADDSKKSTFIDTGNETKNATSNFSADEIKILNSLK